MPTAASGRSTASRWRRKASGREVFVELGEADGYPDGMACDAQGFLWSAHWDGGRISRYAPDGRLDRVIEPPARRITNIAFAGDALDRMFVTSARVGLDDPTEFDGALFEVDSGVTGMPRHVRTGPVKLRGGLSPRGL
jgi:sugar lactone lactonase YvrE